MRILAAVVLALAVTATASAAGPRFRYERPLIVHGAGPYRLVPDALLTGHTRPSYGFEDLRVFDAHGQPVAWRYVRMLPARSLPVRRLTRSARRKQTVVLLDLGLVLPLDEVTLDATTKVYDRPVHIEESVDGRHFWLGNLGRASRFGHVHRRRYVIERAGGTRFVRVTIDNGDDRPLEGIRVRALSHPPELLVAGGAPLPYTLRYGAPHLHAPDYDLARLPLKAVGLGHATRAQLGEELTSMSPSPSVKILKPAPSTRSYRWLVIAGLAVAALVIGAAGFVLVRRTTPT
jgi:hypothetical protein